MNPDFLNIISFLQNIEPLKKTVRTAWTQTGQQETTAEHSWRLAVLVMCLTPYFPEVNATTALEMALVHDLAEAVTGDTSAATKPDHTTKEKDERAAFAQLIAPLPADLAAHFTELFAAYLTNATPEAHLVKALDKAETIIQHNQGANPPDFDYRFNLTYGQKFFTDERLAAFRKIIDTETQKNCQP